MFEGMRQQNIADILKGPILRLSTPDQRNEGLAWIHRLESAAWNANAFQEAFASYAPLFLLDGKRLVFSGTRQELLDTVAEIVQKYLDLIEPPGQTLLTTSEACRYVSERLADKGRKLSPTSVKEYIWERKMIRGQLVGNSMVFRREDLDAFVESYLVLDPKRGRRWHREPTAE